MAMHRRKLQRLIVTGAAMMAAAGLPGCASLSGGRVDCNIVRLQRGAGRSDSDIAAALNVSDAEVASCSGGAGMYGGGGGGEGGGGEYSMPAEAPSGGGEQGGGGGGDQGGGGKPHM